MQQINLYLFIYSMLIFTIFTIYLCTHTCIPISHFYVSNAR